MRSPSVLLAAMLSLSTFAAAADCEMTTSSPEFDTDPMGAGVGPRFYVDDDSDRCARTGLCVISIWVYEESNGVDGLQRGDEIVDDTCGGAAGPSDTII